MAPDSDREGYDFVDNPFLPGTTIEDMDEYEATFKIESKTDAYAVERLTSTLYDSLREESRTIREGSADSTEMLAQFRAIRDAARRGTPGKLTVVYEQHDGELAR